MGGQLHNEAVDCLEVPCYPPEPLREFRVWDLPTRVFHWALAALYGALVTTGWTGGEVMPWHAQAGYAVATLLLFRIAWGFIGGHWSRFASFVFAPASVRDHLRCRGARSRSIGHNPLGALSVFSLLLFLLLQVATGLSSEDKADFAGLMNVLVSSAAAKAATWYRDTAPAPGCWPWPDWPPAARLWPGWSAWAASGGTHRRRAKG